MSRRSSSQHPARRRLAALLLIALAAPSCGQKGDPLPPLRPTPRAVASFRLAQRGERIEISFQAPTVSTDGARLPVLDIEIFVATTDGDFEKVAKVRRFKAAPGERVRESDPLPAPGTLVRAAVRAIAKGHRAPLTAPAPLRTIGPLVVPTDLAARVLAEGVALSWQGVLPEPLPPPEPPPAATLKPGSPPLTLPKVDAPTPDAPPPARPPGDASGQASIAVPEMKPPVLPGFLVYRRARDGTYGEPLTPSPLVERSTTDAGVKPSESWCYVVRAAATTAPLVESGDSNEVCVDVRDMVAPAAPTGVAIVPRDDGIELSFNPAPEPDVTGYRIYRAPRGGPPRRVAEIEAAPPLFVDTEAPPGTPVVYTVTAIDAAGNESQPSAPVETTRR